MNDAGRRSRPAKQEARHPTRRRSPGRPEARPGRERNPDMDHETVESRIRGLVADHLGVGVEDIGRNVSLVDELAADSLDLVEIALAIEANLGVVLPQQFLDEVRTCGQLIDATVALAARRRAERRREQAPVGLRARLTPAAAERHWTVERSSCSRPTPRSRWSRTPSGQGRARAWSSAWAPARARVFSPASGGSSPDSASEASRWKSAAIPPRLGGARTTRPDSRAKATRRREPRRRHAPLTGATGSTPRWRSRHAHPDP
jgi:acyl carrier protein